jgi:gamma-glutamyltranspeptidase/glutathione hydrolase
MVQLPRRGSPTLGLLAVTGLGLLAGCDSGPEVDVGRTDTPVDVSAETREAVVPAVDPGQRLAQGTEFMVAAPTPEAMEAGRAVLQNGGNAVDAAAATAFALWVTDPLMSSVGGRAQILIRMADGAVVGIDGATQAPLRVDEPADLGHGYRTVPIPGAPAALEEMLRDYGTRSLAQLLEPAIRLAEEGFVIKADAHDALRTYQDRLTLYPGTRAHFYKPDGSPYTQGDTLRQPALAETLRAMAEGGTDALYRGPLADAFVADMEEHGGLVRHDDLAQYQPRVGEVVHGEYRGHEIVARGGNCDGASVIEMLQMLEHFDLLAYDRDDPEYIHILSQALYIGQTDEHVPDWIQVSKAHAARRVLEIDLDRALPIATREGSGGDTNHLSVVDGEGNAVAITQSIGPNFGSKVVNPELGFFYAYSYDMNDDPVPFQREKTSQSPTMILDGGTPFLVLGSAGSSRIPGSIVRTAVNVIDHQMSLWDAVEAPRWFIAEDGLRIESGELSAEALGGLRNLGYELQGYEGRDGYFARVHVVMADHDTGLLWGVSDPRDLGAAGGR